MSLPKGAEAVILTIEDERRRQLAYSLTVHAGIQGGRALKYAAQLFRFEIAAGEFPSAPAGLSTMEVEFIKQRVTESLQPYVDVKDARIARAAPRY